MSNQRRAYYKVAPDAVKALSASDRTSPRPHRAAAAVRLVELRVSQINGCAYCVDLHSREAARRARSAAARCLPVWRETPFFDDPNGRPRLGDR